MIYIVKKNPRRRICQTLRTKSNAPILEMQKSKWHQIFFLNEWCAELELERKDTPATIRSRSFLVSFVTAPLFMDSIEQLITAEVNPVHSLFSLSRISCCQSSTEDTVYVHALSFVLRYPLDQKGKSVRSHWCPSTFTWVSRWSQCLRAVVASRGAGGSWTVDHEQRGASSSFLCFPLHVKIICGLTVDTTHSWPA